MYGHTHTHIHIYYMRKALMFNNSNVITYYNGCVVINFYARSIYQRAFESGTRLFLFYFLLQLTRV